LAIVFSVLLWLTYSDYPFGILKLFFHQIWSMYTMYVLHTVTF
jgi:hypothetical protein